MAGALPKPLSLIVEASGLSDPGQRLGQERTLAITPETRRGTAREGLAKSCGCCAKG